MITSLFSGIGGLELGLEEAGLGPVRWQVEQDPFCRQVLAHHWPEAQQHDDVRTATGSLLGRGGVMCGGFPCQDISAANPRGKGLAGARSGRWAGKAPVGEGTGPVEPKVGGLPPGFPRGLDGLRWPRGRGPDQHPWEPPRTVASRSLATRSQRVKAYGNAVVPQCAYIVGLRLKQLMEGT